MSNGPPEDLLIAARILDKNVVAIVRDVVWLEEPTNDWRDFVPDPLKRLWGRISFEARLTAYIVAETAVRGREGD